MSGQIPERLTRGTLNSVMLLAVAAGSTMAPNMAQAQEALETQPTGITDVKYKFECGSPIIGNPDTSGDTVDIVNLHNHGTTGVELNVSGRNAQGVEFIRTVPIEGNSQGALVIPASFLDLILEARGESAELENPCYKAPVVTEPEVPEEPEQPEEPEEPEEPTEPTEPNEEPDEDVGPSPEVVVTPEEPKTPQAPRPETADPAAANVNNLAKGTNQSQGVQMTPGRTKLPKGPKLHQDLKLPRTGGEYDSGVLTGFGAIILGYGLIHMGRVTKGKHSAPIWKKV